MDNIKPWISVALEGWTGAFIVVRSYLGETCRYYNISPAEAERRYREKYGLIGKRLTRRNN